MKKQMPRKMARVQGRSFEWDGAVPFPADKDWLPPAQNVPRPESVEVDRWGPDLMISYRGATGSVDSAAFGVIAGVFASAIFCSLLHAWQRGEIATTALVLAGMTMAVSWLMAYGMLAKVLNETYLRVTSGELLVGSGPLFMGGVRTFQADALVRFYCTRGERPAFAAGDSYGLYALCGDGRLQPILKNLATADEAYYLARVLSRRLGLKDAG
jgi:hypothetical protein